MKFTFRGVVLLGVGLALLASSDRVQAQKKDKKSNVLEIKGLFKVEGYLNRHDMRDRSLNVACQIYTFKMQAGSVYQIDHVRTGTNFMDPYLRIEDENGTELARDDDSGGNLNARIIFTCPANGNYHIIATALGAPQAAASYTLTIQKK
jgi:hypothetical protein